MAISKESASARCEKCHRTQLRAEYCLDIRYCRECVYDYDMSPGDLIAPERTWRIYKSPYCTENGDSSDQDLYHRAATRYKQYKYKAKQKNLAFNLDFGLVLAIPDSSCWYCGDQASNCHMRDLSAGYVDENVVFACKYCAMGRVGRSQDEFIAQAHKIAQIHSE
jgi:hypothetical protein